MIGGKLFIDSEGLCAAIIWARLCSYWSTLQGTLFTYSGFKVKNTGFVNSSGDLWSLLFYFSGKELKLRFRINSRTASTCLSLTQLLGSLRIWGRSEISSISTKAGRCRSISGYGFHPWIWANSYNITIFKHISTNSFLLENLWLASVMKARSSNSLSHRMNTKIDLSFSSRMRHIFSKVSLRLVGIRGLIKLMFPFSSSCICSFEGATSLFESSIY